MDDESFPNAYSAFRDALNQPNPTPKLLELINAHPQHQTISNLIIVYMELVEETPTQIDKFAEALAQLKDSKEVTVASRDVFGNSAQQGIAIVLDMDLAEHHGSDLATTEDTSISPSNKYLIASLLSAASTKYGLCASSAQPGSVAHGLHPKDRRYGDATPAAREVFVLGTCLQLLVSGSFLYGPSGTHLGKDDVLTALQNIKADGLVKNQNGQQLLEAAIQQAEAAFENDVNDAWSILFPGARE